MSQYTLEDAAKWMWEMHMTLLKHAELLQKTEHNQMRELVLQYLNEASAYMSAAVHIDHLICRNSNLDEMA